ncbi:LysR family transcriptional regulator [Streptomyces sp. NPDC058067]|uniref:LysR family transcriptional regulator n=1 Tax=Streptomyces sp. NPDC058067 TaxID=3346324 RepID=UPI0036EA3479
MDLPHLRYFLAVVDRGSIKAAAASAGVTEPSVSQGIRALEHELRTLLFRRIGRGMVPTSAGHALVGPARRLLRDIASAGGSVTDTDGHLRGQLTIHSLPSVSSGTLPTLVAAFRRLHPRVSVTIGSLGEATGLAELLRDGGCDIAVTHLPFDRSLNLDESDRALDDLELGFQEYWVAYPPGAEAPESDPMAWDEVDTPLVVVPKARRHGPSHAISILRMLSPAQQTRRPAATVENREARLAFTLAGVGATWIERSMAETARTKGAQVRALTPRLSVPYGLVFDRHTLSAAAAAFVGLARDHVARSDDSTTARKAAAAGES